MNLLLNRMWPTDKSVTGCLYIDNVFEAFTLEDKDRNLESGGVKIPKETVIPKGRYKVVVDWSDRFQRPMPHILDVPQFTGIRFHVLNTVEETEGCIGLGRDRGEDNYTIINSAVAFNAFFKKLFNVWATGEEIWLEIK